MQHTEPAYPPAPLQGPPPGLLRPRSGLTAGVGFEDPARTLARQTDPPCPPQARTGCSVSRRRGGACENGCRPGGWLCTRLKETRPPAEPRWPPPPAPTCRTFRQTPTGLPPAWSDTFAIHPAAGARKVWHGDGRWGRKGGCGWVRGWDCWCEDVVLCTVVPTHSVMPDPDPASSRRASASRKT